MERDHEDLRIINIETSQKKKKMISERYLVLVFLERYIINHSGIILNIGTNKEVLL